MSKTNLEIWQNMQENMYGSLYNEDAKNEDDAA